MTKYWYGPYDPVLGLMSQDTAVTFKSACAKLRKILSSMLFTGEMGVIYNADPMHLAPRYHVDRISPTVVATMYSTDSRTRTHRSTARPDLKFPDREFILSMRKPHTAYEYWPEYIVHYDGSLTAVKR